MKKIAQWMYATAANKNGNKITQKNSKRQKCGKVEKE